MTGKAVTAPNAPFPGYVGQAHAVRLLATAVRSGRLAHAYLLTGPDGVGKEPLALAVAKAANCPNSRPDGPLYCNQCRVCRRIDRFDYPDVLYLFPVPRDSKSEYDYDEAEAAARLQEKRAEPHRPLASERNLQILIGQIRQMSQAATRSPLEGKLRVVIVSQAHMMNIYTANAFLKILEEPPAHTIFILITPRPHRLPATVISRCQIVRLGRLAREEIEFIIQRSIDLEEAELKRVVPLSAGSAGRGIEMAGDDYQGTEELAAGLVGLLTGDDRGMVESVFELARIADREKLLKAFELLCILHYGKALEDAGQVPFVKSPEALAARLDGLKLAGDKALESVKHAEEAKDALQANVSVSLLIFRWALAVRRLLPDRKPVER